MIRVLRKTFSGRSLAWGVLAIMLAGAAVVPADAQSTSTGQTTGDAATLTITVKGMQSNDGALLWTLYNSQESFEAFDGSTALKKGRCEIKNETCTIEVDSVPYGTYAILVAHDVNDDGEIDRNPLSDELKGVSNYTSKLWWKPNWDDAKFTVDQPNQSISITVY
ncbi:DUF2141 domain-containing protein [Rhodoligotrophos defluvii]|uniref:DUF2141 domain-containing protein n=1 Tax=Rhodoligotrophos defluvii TaxID=2561934 RepID=UPI0010C99B61|nr:DUF2141 domain-containing protein [Rhodoligotrophos defluvii]